MTTTKPKAKPKKAAKKKARKKKDRIDPALVEEFVNVAHTDLKRVTELLETEPALVNAAWDWGGGDWETGLGAAAHMGKRPIAEYLLANGARIDIFAAAMLGQLAFVKAAVKANPGIVDVKGPHGISLMSHAKAGRKHALKVVEFLSSL